jgi:nucleotide-binding universal stress UspA family protein
VPADSILEFVRASGCDLIVMGTHGRRGISHMLRGSVAEAVLRRAPCPVLAMRNPKLSPPTGQYV